MSLLSDLWAGIGGEGDNDRGDVAKKGISKGPNDDGKKSFAQVVCSSSSDDSPASRSADIQRATKRMSKA